MNVFGIIAIGVIGALLAACVRHYRPEYGIAVGAVTGVIIMIAIAGELKDSVGILREIVEKTGIDIKYFSVILKVIGISYITQFGVELCRDAGENAIASKVDSAGKICVMILTIPVISGFLEIIIGMLDAL